MNDEHKYYIIEILTNDGNKQYYWETSDFSFGFESEKEKATRYQDLDWTEKVAKLIRLERDFSDVHIVSVVDSSGEVVSEDFGVCSRWYPYRTEDEYWLNYETGDYDIVE